MKAIPKRTFLLRREEDQNGQMKDVVARRGELIEVTEKESKRFSNDFTFLKKK